MAVRMRTVKPTPANNKPGASTTASKRKVNPLRTIEQIKSDVHNAGVLKNGEKALYLEVERRIVGNNAHTAINDRYTIDIPVQEGIRQRIDSAVKHIRGASQETIDPLAKGNSTALNKAILDTLCKDEKLDAFAKDSCVVLYFQKPVLLETTEVSAGSDQYKHHFNENGVEYTNDNQRMVQTTPLTLDKIRNEYTLSERNIDQVASGADAQKCIVVLRYNEEKGINVQSWDLKGKAGPQFTIPDAEFEAAKNQAAADRRAAQQTELARIAAEKAMAEQAAEAEAEAAAAAAAKKAQEELALKATAKQAAISATEYAVKNMSVRLAGRDVAYKAALKAGELTNAIVAKPALRDTEIELPTMNNRGVGDIYSERPALERSASLPVGKTDIDVMSEALLPRSVSAPGHMVLPAGSEPREVTQFDNAASHSENNYQLVNSIKIPHVHRKRDNNLVLTGAVVALITSVASFAAATVGSKNDPDDTIDELDANADQLNDMAQDLQIMSAEDSSVYQLAYDAGEAAYEETTISAASEDLKAEDQYAADYNAWVDGGSQGPQPQDPGYYSVTVNRISGHVSVNDQLTNTGKADVEDKARTAQNTVIQNVTTQIDSTVATLNRQADDWRAQADNLETQAKKISTDTDVEYAFGAAGLLAFGALTSKYVVNRRHNHVAKNVLMAEYPLHGEDKFDELYKGKHAISVTA